MSIAKIATRVGKSAKVLTLDIETAPSVVYTWGRFKQNIGLNQVIEDGSVICFAAKWYHEKRTMFWSDFHHSHEQMVENAHRLMSEADIIVGYNSRSFDVKLLHKEFILAEMPPPAPHKDVDLLSIVRQVSRWESNKLDNIAQRVEIGAKIEHEGFNLWKSCMNGDRAAWDRMRAYCKGDVELTEKLYDRLRPWIKNHPHMGVNASDDIVTCNRCGSDDLKRDGTWLANQILYTRYQCSHCGAWVRGGRHARAAAARGV